MNQRENPWRFVAGAAVGAVLAACGIVLDDWRFWVVMVAFGVLAETAFALGQRRSVWVVSERIDHHGSEVCGVFPTREAAETHITDHRPMDFHEMTEWKVGSRLHSGWEATRCG